MCVRVRVLSALAARLTGLPFRARTTTPPTFWRLPANQALAICNAKNVFWRYYSEGDWTCFLPTNSYGSGITDNKL